MLARGQLKANLCIEPLLMTNNGDREMTAESGSIQRGTPRWATKKALRTFGPASRSSRRRGAEQLQRRISRHRLPMTLCLPRRVRGWGIALAAYRRASRTAGTTTCCCRRGRYRTDRQWPQAPARAIADKAHIPLLVSSDHHPARHTLTTQRRHTAMKRPWLRAPMLVFFSMDCNLCR